MFLLLRLVRYAAYLLLFLLLLWIICMQAGCFDMRTSDAKWPNKLRKKGQLHPAQYFDVLSASGRTVHAIGMQYADTLPVVVGVHGSPGSADNFLDYMADTAFMRQVQFLSVDRPGFGYNHFGKPEPSLASQASDVKAALAHFAPGAKAILVGHSLGGPLVARFAIDYPEMVAGLVIVAGSIDPDLEPHPWWQKAVDRAPLKWLTPTSMWTSNREIIFLEAELRKMQPLWAQIKCPVWVIHAENDRLVDYRNVDFARKMLVNAAFLKFDTMNKGDHFILWSKPDHIKKAVLDIINSTNGNF